MEAAALTASGYWREVFGEAGPEPSPITAGPGQGQAPLAERAAPRHSSPAVGGADFENYRADDSSSPTQEEPMYSWIAPKPYRHHARFRVWWAGLDGVRAYQTFVTEEEATAFIARSQRLLIKDGRPIEDVINEWLDTRTKLRASTVTTIRYRLKAVIRGRERMPIEAFPWATAWKTHVEPQSGDSQYGILAALQGLVRFANLRGEPLKGFEPSKPKNQGKPQLRVTEAQKFISLAVNEGDPLALAAATMAVTGLRPGEVMALQARDCDDGARLLWVEKGKTKKAKREIEVEEAFRPMLERMAKGKAAGDPLFDYTPIGWKPTKDPSKARIDALLRRVRALCEAANVPEVVSHSLRGLNATLRKLGGASDANVTTALGWRQMSTGDRHYLAPGTREKVEGRRAHGRLLPARAANA